MSLESETHSERGRESAKRVVRARNITEGVVTRSSGNYSKYTDDDVDDDDDDDDDDDNDEDNDDATDKNVVESKKMTDGAERLANLDAPIRQSGKEHVTACGDSSFFSARSDSC